MIIASELSVEFMSMNVEEFDIELGVDVNIEVLVVLVVVVVVDDVVEIVVAVVVEIAVGVGVVPGGVVDGVDGCTRVVVVVAVVGGMHVEQAHSGRAVRQSRQLASTGDLDCKSLRARIVVQRRVTMML